MFSLLLLRLGTLLTSVEYVSWDEETYRGTIAKELIEGLKAPFWDYQADGYDGGPLLIGILAAPFFLFLGPSLFALKLVPLLFSLGTLILTYLLLKRFFDRLTALFACALFVLPPPVFTALSFSAIGSHPESILFSGAILFSFYQFMYGGKNKSIALILFGLFSGLWFWFTSITGITTLTCFVSWFLIDRRSFLTKQMFVFLASFLVGLTPFLIYNLTHHFSFLWFAISGFFYKPDIFQEDYASLWEKPFAVPIRMAKFCLRILPSMFRFRSFLAIPDQFLTLLYGGTAWMVIALFLSEEIRKLFPLLKDSLWRGKVLPAQWESTKPVTFILFPFLFIFIYSASNYSLFPVPQESFVGQRYLSPLYYFILCLLAIALRHRRRAALYLAILVSLGLVGQGSLLFNERFGRAFRYKGYSYFWLGHTWGIYLHPFPEKFMQFKRLADRFQEPDRRYLYGGLSYLLGLLRRDVIPEVAQMEEDPKTALKWINRVPPPYRPFFLENWGRHLSYFRGNGSNFRRNNALGKFLSSEEQRYFYHGLLTKTLIGGRHRIAEIRLMSEDALAYPFREFYYFDLGRSLYWELVRLEPKGWDNAAIDRGDSLGPKQKAWVYRGMGAEAAADWVVSAHFKMKFDSFVAKFSPVDKNEFFWGVGWALGASVILEDEARARDWFDRLPSEAQGSALEGFLASQKWYGFDA